MSGANCSCDKPQFLYCKNHKQGQRLINHIRFSSKEWDSILSLWDCYAGKTVEVAGGEVCGVNDGEEGLNETENEQGFRVGIVQVRKIPNHLKETNVNSIKFKSILISEQAKLNDT